MLFIYSTAVFPSLSIVAVQAIAKDGNSDPLAVNARVSRVVLFHSYPWSLVVVLKSLTMGGTSVMLSSCKRDLPVSRWAHEAHVFLGYSVFESILSIFAVLRTVQCSYCIETLFPQIHPFRNPLAFYEPTLIATLPIQSSIAASLVNC